MCSVVSALLKLSPNFHTRSSRDDWQACMEVRKQLSQSFSIFSLPAWTLTSILSEPADPQRMPYLLPSTHSSHTWRIRTATSECFMLTSRHHRNSIVTCEDSHLLLYSTAILIESFTVKHFCCTVEPKTDPVSPWEKNLWTHMLWVFCFLRANETWQVNIKYK